MTLDELIAAKPNANFDVSLAASAIDEYRERGFTAIPRITTDEEVEWLRLVHDLLFADGRHMRGGFIGDVINPIDRPRAAAQAGGATAGGAGPEAGSRQSAGQGRSCAVPWSVTAPGPGRSPAASTVALKVGWMQKMLASVEACPAPSLMFPAGEPVSVMVCAPPPAGPNAPPLRSSQSG